MPPERLKIIQAQDVSTFDGMFLPDGVHSSLYVYLKLMCQEKENLDRFLVLLIGNLIKIKVNREVPAEAENSVMAILHIFRSFVSYWRFPRKELLEESINAISRFYLWSAPYSKVAKSVLVKLKNEILAPGNAMLERFASESRFPELQSFPEDQPDSLQKSRPVFYIIDSFSERTAGLYSLLNLRSVDGYIDEKLADEVAYGNVLSSEVRALLFLNIIQYDTHLSEEEAAFIYNLTNDDISDLFERTVVVMQESMDMNKNQAEAHRKSHLKNLKSEFIKIGRKNLGRPESDFIKLPDELPVDYLPSIGNIAHITIADHDYYELPRSADIQQLGFTPYPKTPVYSKLQTILKMYVQK
jgi:hypothetical protein